MKRIITPATIFGTVVAAGLVIMEILVVAATAIWAAVGFFDLGIISAILLTIVIVVPAVYGSVIVAISAFYAETDPANN